jgi:hypothetical protein
MMHLIFAAVNAVCFLALLGCYTVGRRTSALGWAFAAFLLMCWNLSLGLMEVTS